MIITQFVLANLADDLPLGVHKLALLARHKSFGMTILMLAILRLLWRLKNAPPELPPGMTALERMLARTTHIAFYFLLFAMPLTGLVDVIREKLFRQLVRLVHLAESHRQERKGLRLLRSTHEILSDVLFVIAVLHILAGAQTSFLEQR